MLDGKKLLKLDAHDIFRRYDAGLTVYGYHLLGYFPSGGTCVGLKEGGIHYNAESEACLLPGLVMPGHCIGKGSVEIEN